MGEDRKSERDEIMARFEALVRELVKVGETVSIASKATVGEMRALDARLERIEQFFAWVSALVQERFGDEAFRSVQPPPRDADRPRGPLDTIWDFFERGA